MSGLVGNPEKRFSHIAAHIIKSVFQMIRVMSMYASLTYGPNTKLVSVSKVHVQNSRRRVLLQQGYIIVNTE